MFFLDYAKSFIGILWHFWLTLNKRPKVTCDIRSVYSARWHPESMHDYKGTIIGEGIRIYVIVGFLIANNGPVDTTIKDIYVDIKYNKEKSGRLISVAWQSAKDVQQKAHIMPRGTWGPKQWEFEGSLWDGHVLPKNMKAELVVEPVAQRPVRREFTLFFLDD